MLTFEMFEQELFPRIRDLCSSKYKVNFTYNYPIGRWTGAIYFQDTGIEIFYVLGGCNPPYNLRKMNFDRIMFCRNTKLEHAFIASSYTSNPFDEIAEYMVRLVDPTIFIKEKSDFKSREIELTLIGKKK